MLLGSNGFAVTAPGRRRRWRSVDRRNVKEARFEPRSGAAYRGVRNHGAGRRPADRRAAAVHLHQGQDRQDPARPGRHAGQRRHRYGVRPRVAQHRPVRDQQERAGRRCSSRSASRRRRTPTSSPCRSAATLRRTDKQQDNGLLLALVDTVTLNRKTAIAVSSDTNPGGAVQKPRAVEDDLPPTNIALPHDGLAYRFPFDTEKQTYPVLRPDRAEGVRRQLRRRGRRQRADHLQVHPERRLRRRRQAGRAGQVRRRSTTTTPTARSPRGRRCGACRATRTSRSP